MNGKPQIERDKMKTFENMAAALINIKALIHKEARISDGTIYLKAGDLPAIEKALGENWHYFLDGGDMIIVLNADRQKRISLALHFV